MIDNKYLTILAESCRDVFQQMARTDVVSIKVKKDERLREVHAVAQVIPYEDMNKRLEGTFVLGFAEEAMAILVATAIAENLGLPPVETYDDTAADILNEFMNTVVGRTISGWDKLGFRVRFGVPVSHKNTNIKEYPYPDIEAYAIILNLAIDHIIFRVTFQEVAGRRMVGKRVMVVDDSSVIRGVLSKALKAAGLEIETAEDGQDAVDKFKVYKPHLTIMDINMPKLSGLDAVVKIQEFAPEAKFIVLTSSSRQDEIMTAKTLKVCSYMVKPVQMKDLLERVRLAISR